MEMQGLLMRGAFEHPATTEDHDIEWCERRILQRIHRRTMSTLRKQIEAVTPAVYMRWLLNWQHLAPQTQLSGEEGVLEALHQLEGFEAPAIEWERTVLPARVANYDPRWLDALCLSGAVGWGRISPHPAWSTGDGAAPRRVIPTNAAPITFYIRETADWLPHALSQQCVEEAKLQQALSPEALQVRALLQQRGACFSNDIQRILNLSKQQTQHALWELATAGLAAADGFDQLRAMMDPAENRPRPILPASVPPAAQPDVGASSPKKFTPLPPQSSKPAEPMQPSSPQPAHSFAATESSSATCSSASPTLPAGATFSASCAASKPAARFAAAASSPALAASSSPSPGSRLSPRRP